MDAPYNNEDVQKIQRTLEEFSQAYANNNKKLQYVRDIFRHLSDNLYNPVFGNDLKKLMTYPRPVIFVDAFNLISMDWKRLMDGIDLNKSRQYLPYLQKDTIDILNAFRPNIAFDEIIGLSLSQKRIFLKHIMDLLINGQSTLSGSRPSDYLYVLVYKVRPGTNINDGALNTDVPRVIEYFINDMGVEHSEVDDYLVVFFNFLRSYAYGNKSNILSSNFYKWLSLESDSAIEQAIANETSLNRMVFEVFVFNVGTLNDVLSRTNEVLDAPEGYRTSVYKISRFA